LADELAKAHVIITTALIPCRPAPELITEDVVKRMRDGLGDRRPGRGQRRQLQADRAGSGGERHGVTLVGHTNYPSMVPSDASAFYAKNLSNLLEIMVDKVDAGRWCSRTWPRTRSPRRCWSPSEGLVARPAPHLELRVPRLTRPTTEVQWSILYH
jgi:hypothetical protein